MRIARRYLSPIALLLVSTIGVAYAATTLFTQTFPAIPATTPALTSNCTTLTPNVSSVVTGSSGFVEFDCSGSAAFGTTPAFTLTPPVTVTPQFTLPTEYTALGVFHPADAATLTACPTGPPLGGALTNGQPAFLGSTFTSYDYCTTYSNAPSTGLATFDITWTP